MPTGTPDSTYWYGMWCGWRVVTPIIKHRKRSPGTVPVSSPNQIINRCCCRTRENGRWKAEDLHPRAMMARIRQGSKQKPPTEVLMKFMLTFTWTPNPQARAEGLGRFQKTGGLPPPGLELLGRWTRADLSGGFDLLETDDPKKLVEFAYMWSDLM